MKRADPGEIETTTPILSYSHGECQEADASFEKVVTA